MEPHAEDPARIGIDRLEPPARALDDIAVATDELRRIAKKGLRGAMIWAEPPVERPYSHPDYEPFFAAAQELDMKLSLHSLTSRRKDSDPAKGDMLYSAAIIHMEVGRTISDLILHGVCEKFPRLQFVSAENEIAWLPFHLSPVYSTLIWFNPREWPFWSSVLAAGGVTALLLWKRRAWPWAMALALVNVTLLLPALGLSDAYPQV